MLRRLVKRRDPSVLNVKAMVISKMSVLITSYIIRLRNKHAITLTVRKTMMKVTMMKVLKAIEQLMLQELDWNYL